MPLRKKLTWTLAVVVVALLVAWPFRKDQPSSSEAADKVADELDWRGQGADLVLDIGGSQNTLPDHAVDDRPAAIQFSASSKDLSSTVKVKAPALRQTVPPPSLAQAFEPGSVTTSPATVGSPATVNSAVTATENTSSNLVDQYTFLSAPQQNGDKENHDRQPPARMANLPKSGTVEPAADAHPEPSSPTRRHRISDGDSLPELAQKYLGDRNRHLEIYQLNRDLLSTPNALPIGIEIQIPN